MWPVQYFHTVNTSHSRTRSHTVSRYGKTFKSLRHCALRYGMALRSFDRRRAANGGSSFTKGCSGSHVYRAPLSWSKHCSEQSLAHQNCITRHFQYACSVCERIPPKLLFTAPKSFTLSCYQLRCTHVPRTKLRHCSDSSDCM